MKRVCAWCKRDMGEVEPRDDPRVTSGICAECTLKLRLEVTVRELRAWRGIAAIIVPGNREDLLLQLWRAVGPGATFIVFPDRRRAPPQPPRAPGPPAGPPNRRRFRLSCLIPEWSRPRA